MTSPEERQTLRERLLLALYERVGDRIPDRVQLRELVAIVGTTEDEIEHLGQYLVDEGLAEWPAMGGYFAITHEGIREAERLLTGGRDPSATAVLSVQDLRAVEAFAGELRRMPEESLALSEEERAELQADLESLEAQLRSPRPRRNIVRATLACLRDLLVSAGGSGLVLGAEALIRRLA